MLIEPENTSEKPVRDLHTDPTEGEREGKWEE